MMTSAAFIAGCSGPVLTAEEAAFFRGERPWGFILFRRNCETASQVADLVAALRHAVGRADAPVLIDQEGGRVQRLQPPAWRSYPPPRTYGAIHARDPVRGRRAAYLGARLIAADLAALGIDVDCLPLLDVPVDGAHDVIGDRAYGPEPQVVAELGRETARGLADGGVLPVVKHMPGHGRAGVDSHKALPVVDTPREILEQSDFLPFRLLADQPLGMSAHVVYTAIDPHRPATLSPVVIGEVIRGSIGFDGCLMTDDLSMHALGGGFASRARGALDAGVDLVLHCNGNLAEMADVAAGCRPLAGRSGVRADRALAARHRPLPCDEAALRAEFAELVTEALA